MIATIGEALIDFIEQPNGLFQACPGGSVYNFSLGLGRQNIETHYLMPFSGDAFGRKLRARLTASKVSVPEAPSDLPTSLALVQLDQRGVASYTFYRDNVADRDRRAEQLIAALPAGAKLMYTGCLALVPEDIEKMLAVIAAAAQRGMIISVDANLRPLVVKDVVAYVQGVRRALSVAHILKVSDEDCEMLKLDPQDLEQIHASLFAAEAPQIVAVTRGSEDASMLTRKTRVTCPVPKNLPVVDTVGAGDCFHAGLIAYLAHNGKLTTPEALGDLPEDVLRAALQHAIYSASVNVMRAGCDPATWEEVEALEFSRK